MNLNSSRKEHRIVGHSEQCPNFSIWKTFLLDDHSGRGRPKGFFVEIPSPHFCLQQTPRKLSNSSESIPELIPPSIPLTSDDEKEEVAAAAAIVEKPRKKSSKKKETSHLPIVSQPVELPLKREEKQAITIVFSPCLQFPKSYCSPSEITIDFWRRYHTMRVSFSQKEIGFFSTADRADRTRCREDYRYLKKLIYPLEAKKVHFDLNVGAEYLDAKVRISSLYLSLYRFSFKQEPPASLDSMMWWIIRHKDELFADNKYSHIRLFFYQKFTDSSNFRFKFDFLSWRGTLRKIMSSLFDSTCDWRIGIIRWHGCHFMTVFHTETELKIETDQTPVEKRMQYWGHKFEDYITCTKLPLIPSPTKIFSTMNRASLGRHTLLYSCEIDACTANSQYDVEKQQGTFVEVKITYAKHLLDLNTES